MADPITVPLSVAAPRRCARAVRKVCSSGCGALATCLCASCLRVAYCSSACAKASWDARTGQHKVRCGSGAVVNKDHYYYAKTRLHKRKPTEDELSVARLIIEDLKRTIRTTVKFNRKKRFAEVTDEELCRLFDEDTKAAFVAFRNWINNAKNEEGKPEVPLAMAIKNMIRIHNCSADLAVLDVAYARTGEDIAPETWAIASALDVMAYGAKKNPKSVAHDAYGRMTSADLFSGAAFAKLLVPTDITAEEKERAIGIGVGWNALCQDIKGPCNGS